MSFYVEIPGVIAMDEQGRAHGDMIDWVPGPREKLHSTKNTLEFFATHSVVGKESEFHDGIPDRFLDMTRDSQGRFTPYAAASCQVVNRLYDTHNSGFATLKQMYYPDDSTWTSGSTGANTRSGNMELEGGGYHPDGKPFFTQPINEPQTKSFCVWLIILEKWKTKKTGNAHLWVPEVNIKPHWQMVEMFGGGTTLCDSGRYAEGLRRLAAFRKEIGETMDARLEEMIWRMADILTGSPPGTSTDAHGDRLKALKAEWDTKAPMVAAIRNQQTALTLLGDMKASAEDVKAISQEMTRIANELATHRNAPHVGDGLVSRDELVRAFEAGAASANGETP